MNELNPILVEESYPFQDLLGFRMTGWTTDWARFELDLAERHMNRYGIPHGGAYAALLDAAMGFSGSYTGDPDRRQMAMTLSMTTNFLSRPVGTMLIAEARRTGGGKSSFFSEATLTDDTGLLCATGSGVFRYRKSG